MGVRSELRGRGVGTALIQAAEDRARRRGHQWIAISVNVDNTSAARLYEWLGYIARMQHRGISNYLDSAGTKHVVDAPAIFMVKDISS